MYEKMQAESGEGRRYVQLIDEHAKVFSERAPHYDRTGELPFVNYEEMQVSGVMAAMVPEAFGGLGVRSIHDMIVGVSRLGRVDASTAIAANMHIATGLVLRLDLEEARASGDQERASEIESLLRQIGAGKITFSLLGSESGTDQLHPQVRATRVEGGYVINGRKIFGTLSTAANRFIVFVAVDSPDGEMEIASVLLPRDTEGLEVQDNWDAMGMRASGSNDVVFKNCFVSEEMFGKKRQGYGRWSAPWFKTIIIENLGLTSVFFGIAEAARDYAIEKVLSSRKHPSGKIIAERPTIQHWIAEIEIELVTAKSVLEACARRVDVFLRDAEQGAESTVDDLHQLNKLFQITKNVVTSKAVTIVDKAMTATGGAGYMNASPLSRWYRDVRAGPIMQTYSPNEQYEYIGKATLGLPMTMTT
ncbi:MAG: acyl-CoA/acyl-ACP dehydrogenase [Rhodospirillum sp.]|nr:acyl-CoA/acyl-ACP dehydrogenase [Rhodospirillum sp.]MCF8488349.1 acyl-CoA/acyl-ACP dehydrogenase [Rhodospirillum sp.]